MIDCLTACSDWWALVRWGDESPRMADADPDDVEWREWLPVVAWAALGEVVAASRSALPAVKS